MESRVRSFFLSGCFVFGLVMGAVDSAQAADSDAAPPQVIEPEVERRDIREAKIDTEDFEIGGFFGLMSVEDFGANAVYGARLTYHINEALFMEGTYGSTDTDLTTAEELGQFRLFEDRKLSYYDASLGWNLFPGEVFRGRTRAYNMALYLIGGLGSTDFAGDDQFTVNFGFGFRFYPTDWIALRLDARNYMFDLNITGKDKTTHNLTGTLGISFFF